MADNFTPLMPINSAAFRSKEIGGVHYPCLIVYGEDGTPVAADIRRLAPVALGASSDLTFSSASAQSGALAGTLIRVVAKGADCRIATGADPTAVATGTLIVAGIPEYFAITSGHKVAAIRDAADGTLNITVVG